MRKLVHHKNILQLLDWSTVEGESQTQYLTLTAPKITENTNTLKCVFVLPEPYILIMEYVSCGTLRTFLQTNRTNLSASSELQSLLTIASYQIALAMQYLRSKMVKRQKQQMLVKF